MIDLEGEELENGVVDNVLEALDIELVTIETDLIGLNHLLKFFEGWLDVPRFSGSGAQPNTSRINAVGAHPEFGIGLLIKGSKNYDNSMKFIGNKVVLEEIVNYT